MVHIASIVCSLSSSREDTEIVIIYGLTLPFPAPLSDGLLFLFLPDPTSFYFESLSFIRKRPLDFEPRSPFKSWLSLIVRANVVLNRTVVVDSSELTQQDGRGKKTANLV